jgi:hypothetical protein
MTYLLYVDSETGRIAHFGLERETPPSRITIIDNGVAKEIDVDALQKVHYQGVIPLSFNPQVSWLFKYLDGAIELRPA